MASSATITTTHLSTFRTIVEEWNQNRLKKSATKGFLVPLAELQQSPLDKSASKDVIVAFRTRPPLPNEAADKFHADPDAKDAPVDEDGQLPAVEFCSGITVTSAEPGVFVAHVPGMKVTALSHLTERVTQPASSGRAPPSPTSRTKRTWVLDPISTMKRFISGPLLPTTYVLSA